MYHIETNSSKIMFWILFIVGIGKLFWIVLGVVMLFVNLNANNEPGSEVIKCSSNVTNFLIAYFTEIIYITLEGGKSLIQGMILNENF